MQQSNTILQHHQWLPTSGAVRQRGGGRHPAAPRGAARASQVRAALIAISCGVSVSVLLLFVVLPHSSDGRLAWGAVLPYRQRARGSTEAPSSEIKWSGYFNADWWTSLPSMHDTVITTAGDGHLQLPDEVKAAPSALMTHEQLSQLQQQWVKQMAQANGSTTGFAFNQSSVGILLVTKHRQLLSVFVNLRVLREHLNCTLPVEVVWHGPTEAPPLVLQKAVASLPGVRLVDSSNVLPPPPFHVLGRGLPEEMSFRAKAWALAFATSFTHVLLLDSDNLPLVDPRRLFRLPEYKEHGNLFWPDWWGSHFTQPSTKLSIKPALYALFNLPLPWTKQGQAAAAEQTTAKMQRQRQHSAGSGLGTGARPAAAGRARALLSSAGLPLPSPSAHAPQPGWPLLWLTSRRVARGSEGAQPTAAGTGGAGVAWLEQGGDQEAEEQEGRVAGPPRFLCTESGQVLFDRSRHLDTLIWMWWLMMQPHVAHLAHGDKDLWRVAFSLAHKAAQFQQVAIPPRCALSVRPHALHFMGIVQLSPQGRPLFHHRTGPAKYFHNNPDMNLSTVETQKVDALSSPISHKTAYQIVGRWSWPAGMVDLDPWDRKACVLPPDLATQLQAPARGAQAGAGSPAPKHQAGAGALGKKKYPPLLDVPEAWCSKLDDGFPKPAVWPLERFGQRGHVIQVAHELMLKEAQLLPKLLMD